MGSALQACVGSALWQRGGTRHGRRGIDAAAADRAFGADAARRLVVGAERRAKRHAAAALRALARRAAGAAAAAITAAVPSPDRRMAERAMREAFAAVGRPGVEQVAGRAAAPAGCPAPPGRMLFRLRGVSVVGEGMRQKSQVRMGNSAV